MLGAVLSHSSRDRGTGLPRGRPGLTHGLQSLCPMGFPAWSPAKDIQMPPADVPQDHGRQTRGRAKETLAEATRGQFGSPNGKQLGHGVASVWLETI